MARIKLTLPGTKLASIKLPVRITDINYGNHLGNDALVSIIHEARVQWLKMHNLSELDIGGTSLIMGDLAVEYKAEAFYGDELIINIYSGEISKLSFELYYEVLNHKNTLIAKAKTGLVCYNYELRKVDVVPESFIVILQQGRT